MAYNWRETIPFYASTSGLLAGFSIAFIVFLLREDQSSQQIGYGISWGILSALMMGISAVLFIQAPQYFLTAKDHDVYGMPKEKFDLMSEQVKKDEVSKAMRNAILGGRLYNVGRLTLFLGVTFALLPFSWPVALVVGAGGIGFELYQIVSAKKPTKETKASQATSKARRRSLKTYLRLTLLAVILVGFNDVFTKLFDLLIGKTDLGYIVGIFVDILVFAVLFTFLLWWADEQGRLARLLGARDEDL